MNIKNSKPHINTINRKKIFFLLMTISLFFPTAHADDFWYGGRLKVGTGTTCSLPVGDTNADTFLNAVTCLKY